MKKRMLTTLLISMVILLTSCGSNGYTGTYLYEGNSNISLRLDKDGSFIIYNTIGKNSEFSKGQYSIEDNAIKLKFNGNGTNPFLNKELLGKVEGSKIVIDNLANPFVRR